MALILLLAGTAFIGDRLLTDRQLPAGNRQVVVSDSNGGVSTSGIIIETLHADEMPDQAPDVAGLFTRREDNHLFGSTGSTSAMKVGDRWEYQHDGPVIEMITTHNTCLPR
jgi:hypothetical protein